MEICSTIILVDLVQFTPVTSEPLVTSDFFPHGGQVL